MIYTSFNFKSYSSAFTYIFRKLSVRHVFVIVHDMLLLIYLKNLDFVTKYKFSKSIIGDIQTIQM